MKERAQKAAEYLGEEQWGTKETEEEIRTRRQKLNKKKIVAKAEEKYRVGEITKKELKMVIKKLKRRKAPGPDEIPTDFFKEMDEDTREEIRELLNKWWREEDIPEEELEARVVMIYKKGDTSKYENYRPISLLNTIYKLYAAIIQRRLAEKLDKHLQKTQYGFRRNRGTADAVFLVRRVAEYGEKTTNKLIMVLLDGKSI